MRRTRFAASEKILPTEILGAPVGMTADEWLRRGEEIGVPKKALAIAREGIRDELMPAAELTPREKIAQDKIVEILETSGLSRDQQREALGRAVDAKAAGSNVAALELLQAELDALPRDGVTGMQLLSIAQRTDAITGGNASKVVIDKIHELHQRQEGGKVLLGDEIFRAAGALQRAEQRLPEIRVELDKGRQRFRDSDHALREADALESQLDDLGGKSTQLEAEFVRAAGMSSAEWRRRVTLAAKQAPIVPLTSANNVEVTLMGCAHVWAAVMVAPGITPEQVMAASDGLDPVAMRHREHVNVALNMASGGDENLVAEISIFAMRWRESSYAKLEVGHKLAASLCLTDVPDDADVQMPWPAWSLVVPDGLLGDLARIWVLDSTDRNGRPLKACILIDKHGRRPALPNPVEFEMIQSLVLGSALALSNPEDFAKERRHAPTARSSKRREHGAPDLTNARFLLSTPVTVDLREHVKAALEDARHGRRRGSSPKVQFLVRGHWRNQAHGPGHALRRRQWISPFWRGPEETRVLLRTHTVKQ